MLNAAQIDASKPIIETEHYELIVVGGEVSLLSSTELTPRHYAVRNKNHDVIEYRGTVLMDAEAVLEAYEAGTYPKSGGAGSAVEVKH